MKTRCFSYRQSNFTFEEQENRNKNQRSFLFLDIHF